MKKGLIFLVFVFMCVASAGDGSSTMERKHFATYLKKKMDGARTDDASRTLHAVLHLRLNKIVAAMGIDESQIKDSGKDAGERLYMRLMNISRQVSETDVVQSGKPANTRDCEEKKIDWRSRWERK